MAHRKLIKKWVVHTHEDRTWGLKIPISVDTSTGVFWAEYPEGEYIEEDSQSKCVAALEKAITEHNSLVWASFIAIELPHRGRSWDSYPKTMVGFKKAIRFQRACIERKERDRRGEEQVRRSYRYENYPGEVGHCHPSRLAVVFPYSEELWQRVCDLRTMLEEMHKQLDELLRPAEGEDGAAVAARLLALADAPVTPQLPGPAKRKAPPPPPKRKRT